MKLNEGDEISDIHLNLIRDQWIPVLTENGNELTLAPHEIFGVPDGPPVTAFAAPRPDFNGALVQFMIGLVQTTMMPEDADDWADALFELPSEGDAASAFSKVEHAFNLGGDGPRFMQDGACVDQKQQGIDGLLIEMPGDNTLKNNADLFLKRETVQRVCPSCAAMTLLSLQINGPPGGAGHRTGIRGGGPLTSLVLGDTLAETIWLNVLSGDQFGEQFEWEKNQDEVNIFPWMGPLRTSENNQRTSVLDANQLQMYWATGRRIWLDIEKTDDEKTCDLCGCSTEQQVANYRTKTYGVAYDETWRHPLTPYYQSKEQMLPVHCQPGGLSYRNWLGLALIDGESHREPAAVINRFYTVYDDIREKMPIVPRLWSFGYDLDNMKARCWYESTMPLFPVEDTYRDAYELQVAQIVRTASHVHDTLRNELKNAGNRYSPEVSQRFWSETGPLFYETVDGLRDVVFAGEEPDDLKRNWLSQVNRQTRDLFDFYAQLDRVESVNLKKVIEARKKLIMFTHPNGKKTAQTLGLSTKKSSKSKKK